MGSVKVKRLRVRPSPVVLRWAIERAGRSSKDLAKSFPKIEAWVEGRAQPTLKQLERLAKVLYVPVGFFFLESPPEEKLPIPDFRTKARAGKHSVPSPELLETIYACQRAQDWYREYLLSAGAERLPFVGSVPSGDDPREVAARIRRYLKFDVEERSELPTWTQAFSLFIDQVENTGITVMVNSVVGNNSRRRLDPDEFRGFALVDDVAPLIFVNGADTIAAKTFTLAHELVHVWLGRSGVSDAEVFRDSDEVTERWCNQVAAEILVPAEWLKKRYVTGRDLQEEVRRLAGVFKVSPLVVLRKLFDEGYLTWERYSEAYEKELKRLLGYERRTKGGGNFYATLKRRMGTRLAEALVASVYEGSTLFRDAFHLLGITKVETFERFAETLRAV